MVGNPLYSMPKDLQENGKEKLLTICFYFHRYRKYFCGWVHLQMYSNTVLLKWNVLSFDLIMFVLKNQKSLIVVDKKVCLEGEKIGGICYFYAYSTILCFTTFLIAIYDYLPYKCTQHSVLEQAVSQDEWDSNTKLFFLDWNLIEGLIW